MKQTRGILRSLFLTTILLSLFSIGASASDGSGMQISGAADIAGQIGLNEGSGATNRIDPREMEFVLYGPADHLFEGTLSFAAHFEGTLPTVELHEGYISSSKLIPRSNIKLGMFFLGVGRINQLHRHDWPFITAPTYHEKFFAFEGALDTGIEYSYLMPLPFFLELTAGVTNGWTFGHSHVAGAKPYVPTHYLRALTYTGLPGKGGMQVGLNYVGRSDSTNQRMGLFGVDLVAKWREATQVKFLLQSEVWYRTLTAGTGGTTNEFGFYIFPEYYLGNSLFAGLRIDYYTNLSLDDGAGGLVKNFQLNFVPQISYKASHFATLRLAANVQPNYSVNRFTNTNKIIEFQTIFILGAHPAHDF